MGPDIRVGDADRDDAVRRLREHLAQGRLDPDEFDERMGAALAARTRADLDRLFVDLPEDGQAMAIPQAVGLARPGAAPVAPRPAANVAAVLSAVTWPAVLIFLFATGWHLWWLIFIPTLLLPAVLGLIDPHGRSSGRNRGGR